MKKYLPNLIVLILSLAMYLSLGVWGEALAVTRLIINAAVVFGTLPALIYVWGSPELRSHDEAHHWLMLITGVVLSQAWVMVMGVEFLAGNSPPFWLWMVSDIILIVFAASFIGRYTESAILYLLSILINRNRGQD